MKTGASLKNRQGGAVAVIVGISIVLLVGFLAMVIDLGHLYIAKTGLQNAADAAALSGAKQLDGSANGICCGDGTSGTKLSTVYMAIDAAGRNTFFGNSADDVVNIGSAVPSNTFIRFSSSSLGSENEGGIWGVSIATAMANPADKYFIKVDTASGNMTAWFAPIWNIFTTSTYGMAVAGRFPPGSIAPLFVPAVRRNADQANQPVANGTAPYCNGVMYDPNGVNSAGKKLKNNSCPYDSQNGSFPYRVPDDTLNWGFLTPQDTGKTFPAFAGITDSCPVLDALTNTCRQEYPGSYYVITPTPNNSAGTPWVSGTSWTGNFGFMLHSADVKTLNDLAAALCRGSSVASYPIPGCGEVHTGNLSGPKIADNINTRFDLYGNQTQLPQAACPPDTNIYDPGSTTWTSNGYYAGYSAGTLTQVSPTNFPPGVANRRLINVYVADNVVLPGENLAGNQDLACWANTLTGGSQEAHIVGCAQFFVWTKAANDGKLYAEFVKKLDPSQCGTSLASLTGIRLYQ